jgi:hypothetical protein
VALLVLGGVEYWSVGVLEYWNTGKRREGIIKNKICGRLKA